MTGIATTRAIGPAAVLGAALLWGTVDPAQVLAASEADPGSLGVARLLWSVARRWRSSARGWQSGGGCCAQA